MLVDRYKLTLTHEVIVNGELKEADEPKYFQTESFYKRNPYDNNEHNDNDEYILILNELFEGLARSCENKNSVNWLEKHDNKIKSKLIYDIIVELNQRGWITEEVFWLLNKKYEECFHE